MPGLRKASAYKSAATSLVTTAETTVVSVGGIDTPTADAQVTIEADLTLTTGAGTTGVTLKVYRGATTAGVVVAQTTAITAAAAAEVNLSISGIDTPGLVDEQAYSVSVQQAAATGNGSMVEAAITVLY